jgi:hypothetical protein
MIQVMTVTAINRQGRFTPAQMARLISKIEAIQIITLPAINSHKQPNLASFKMERKIIK